MEELKKDLSLSFRAFQLLGVRRTCRSSLGERSQRRAVCGKKRRQRLVQGVTDSINQYDRSGPSQESDIGFHKMEVMDGLDHDKVEAKPKCL